MAKIKTEVLERIKSDNIVIGRLMVHLNKSSFTIQRMIDNNDHRLTRPSIIQILTEETGLTDEQILETEPEEVRA